MENIRNWRNPDPSVEARIRNCLGESLIIGRPSMSLLIKTSNERLILSEDRSRHFITGIEYRTKFMREVSNVTNFKKKYRTNSRNQLPFEAKTRPDISKEQRTKREKLRVQQRARFKDASKSTTQASSNQPDIFFQANLLHAKITATKMTNDSFNSSCKRQQPSPSMSGVSEISLEGNEPSKNKKEKKSVNRKVSMKKAFYDVGYKAEAEETTVLMIGLKDDERTINRQELCIRLPNSPHSIDSSSLHTTPRSPGFGQKIIPISFIYDGNCNCPNDSHDSLIDAMDISNPFKNSIVLHNSNPCLNKIKSTVFTAYLIPVLEWIKKDTLADPEERNDVYIGLEISMLCSSRYVVDQKSYCTSSVNLFHFLPAAPENPHNILSSFDRAFRRGNINDKKSSKDKIKSNEGLSRSFVMNTTNNTVKDHLCHPSNFDSKQFTRPQSVSSTKVSQLVPYGKGRPAFDNKTDGEAKRPASSPAIQRAGTTIQYVRENRRPIWK